ncbi:ABC transporter permease [Kitasatospora sp. NPDC098652]|uniref:ABC transporter permease n=1 Tax=Kitasatospora sp. NPDC098652 TaxID=3364095 RepID=UPI0037F4C196
MNALTRWGSVVTTASRIGFRELTTFYTWRTWLFGWFLRLIAQVLFFGTIGMLSGSDDRVRYLAVGNAAVVVCIEAMVVITTTVRERGQGTLALQVAAPADFALSYLARGAYCLVVGIVSSTGVFAVAALVFRLSMPFPEVLLVPLFLAVAGCSAYGLGTAVGALVLRRPGLQWLALNTGYMSLMTFCGVNVPVDYWPAPVAAAAQLLPLTHGLQALRDLLAGASAPTVLGGLGCEVLVGLAWTVLGVVLLKQAVAGERRRGTIELSA